MYTDFSLIYAGINKILNFIQKGQLNLLFNLIKCLYSAIREIKFAEIQWA